MRPLPTKAWLPLSAVLSLAVLMWPASVWGRLAVGDITETTEAVAGDVYMAGNAVTVRHDVRDDTFVAGSSVSVTAATGGDVVAAGNTVRLTGAAGDDIAVAGNEVSVVVPRADDIFAAGSVVQVSGEAVAGNVYIFGSQVQLSGNYNGHVRVAGDTIVVTSGTTITGDLLTIGDREPVIEDGVTIRGSRRHQGVDEQRSRWAWAGRLARRSLTWFISGLLLLWLFRALITETVEQSLARSGRALGLGALASGLALPLFTVLLVSRIAWPLAWLVLAAAGVLLAAAYVSAALVVGTWAVRRRRQLPARGEAGLPWQLLLAGVIILQLAMLVPVIGWLAATVVTLIAFGALLENVWRRLRAGQSRPEKETESV